MVDLKPSQTSKWLKHNGLKIWNIIVRRDTRRYHDISNCFPLGVISGGWFNRAGICSGIKFGAGQMFDTGHCIDLFVSQFHTLAFSSRKTEEPPLMHILIGNYKPIYTRI